MPEPYTTVFNHPELGEFATVVMDKDEFDPLCDELIGILVLNLEPKGDRRAAAAQVESLKAAATIPMIIRGKATEFIFERYEIEQDRMSVIVRGAGRKVLDTLMEQVDDETRKDAEKN